MLDVSPADPVVYEHPGLREKCAEQDEILYFAVGDHSLINGGMYSRGSDQSQLPSVARGPVGLEAATEGELVSVNGCLRLRGIDGTDYERHDDLLIWPSMSEMMADGQGVRLSKNSEVTLSVGDRIRMSGGVAALSHVRNIVAQPIPTDCAGPYWLVGKEISVYSE